MPASRPPNPDRDLMIQASDTAATYPRRAVSDIDSQFGAGFAKANPALVAAYMQTAAADFSATFGLQGVSTSLGDIADRLSDIADSLGTSVITPDK